MATDWTAFDMAEALRAAVAARAGITGLSPTVKVITYLPSPDEQMADAIIIGYLSEDADDTMRAHVGGDQFEEVVDLVSRIQVTRPGAGQTVADTARDRAQALLSEVEAEVRYNLPTVGDQSRNGKIIERDAAVLATNREGAGALVCALDFTIRYTARTSS